jgi:hypothetical protein
MAFEVAYLIWKVFYLKTLTACLEWVVDELELSVNVIPLWLEKAVLVIDLMIVLDLCKRVAALLVCHGFVEGMEGRGWAHEEIVEPGGHEISGIWGIVWCEV